ncbi:MAG: tetratricopeptide repeat protein [Minicystis sp.]
MRALVRWTGPIAIAAMQALVRWTGPIAAMQALVRWAGPIAIAAALGCAGPAEIAPLTAAQRLNAEGLRRLARGDADAAEPTFRDALREATLVDNLRGQAEAWNNLGALAAARGDMEEARRDHRRALSLHEERAVRDLGEVRARANLGMALLRLGDAGAAEAQLAEAAALAERLGRPEAALLARVGLAAAALHRGDPARAAALARAVGLDAQWFGDDAARAAALAVEGSARAALGDARGARARLEQALAIDRSREAPREVAEDLRALARVAEQAGDRSGAARYWARCARAARWRGDLAEAERALRQAIAMGGSGEGEALKAELAAVMEARTAGARARGSAPRP